MIPPPQIKTLTTISDVNMEHMQIYVAGRYRKHERHISNSPWFIGGRKLVEDSVEELIANVVDPFFGAKSHKFSSAGREDADVLMLNDGRPFYLELVHPVRTVATSFDMLELTRTIETQCGGKVSVRDLQIVPRDSISVLKDSVSTKSKTYKCVVSLSTPIDVSALDPINAVDEIVLKQRNPTRVPRRADLVRDKVIESIAITSKEVKEGKCESLVVDLQTSAGTYVKVSNLTQEFMHGDDGRTEPSLSSLLGCSVVVDSLDVLKIHLAWPPRIEDAKEM
jgi:tRNA pseudouridine synthase 10